jgi:hypothetical protein
MQHDHTPVERAFQLAKCGSCGTIEHIKMRLRAEGYSVAQIEGKALRKQLLGLIRLARG